MSWPLAVATTPRHHFPPGARMSRIQSLHALAVESTSDARQLYLFQVVWDDKSLEVVKRDYAQLYELHCTILDLHPHEAGTAGGQARVIPPFPGKKHSFGIGNAAKRARSLAEKRLPDIARWATGLIALDAKISQSAILLKFFAGDKGRSVALTGDSAAATSHGLDEGSVYHQGYLTKQGVSNKTWKTRHCVLSANGQLHYYLDLQAKVPIKSVDLGAVKAVHTGAEETPPNGWPEGTNPGSSFCVVLEGRTFYFISDSEGESRGWIQSIEELISLQGDDESSTDSEDVFRGHLFKQGNSHKSWKERFFKLTHGGKLYYFADKRQGAKPLGVVDAADILAVNLGEKEEAPYGWPSGVVASQGFSLYTAARTYYLYAHTNADRGLWVEWMSRASQHGWERRHTVSLARRPAAEAAEPGDAGTATAAGSGAGAGAGAGTGGSPHGIAPSLVARVGFLTKQGVSNKTWKTRHCVLTTAGALHYYLDLGDQTPHKTLSLAQARAVREGVRETPPTGWKAGFDPGACFSVEFPERTFYFSAEDAGQAAEWVADLRKMAGQQSGGESSEPLHLGYLYKLGNAASKSWKERFAFVGPDGSLHYAADKQKAGEELGCISREEVLEIHLGEKDQGSSAWPSGLDARHGFSLYTAGRTYYFAAHSPRDRDHWVQLLRKVTAQDWKPLPLPPPEDE